MAIVKLSWCASTVEGTLYLDRNGYEVFCRLTRDLWLVNRIGNYLLDVKIVEN